MKLNRRGQAALAQAGTVSIDGRVIYPRGTSAAWLDDDTLVFNGLEPNGDPENLAAWHLYEYRLGVGPVEIHPLGANDLKARGGRWAAWRAGYGLFTEAGLFSRSAGLLDVGPGGELVYTRNQASGIGFVVNIAGADVYGRSDVVASDVRSYGGTRVSWRNPDGSIQSSFTQTPIRIPGETIFGAVFVELAGDAWMVYHNGRVLRARPIGSTVGIAIHSETPEQYFSHDAIMLADGRLQVSWSDGPGELASDYRPPVIVDVATEPRVDFARSTHDTPPPIVPLRLPFPINDILPYLYGPRGARVWPKGALDLQIDWDRQRAEWIKGGAHAYEAWDEKRVRLWEDHSDDTPGYALTPGDYWLRRIAPGDVLRVRRPAWKIPIQSDGSYTLVPGTPLSPIRWWYDVRFEWLPQYPVPQYGRRDLLVVTRQPVNGDGTPQRTRSGRETWERDLCDADVGRLGFQTADGAVTWFDLPTPDAPRPTPKKPFVPYPPFIPDPPDEEKERTVFKVFVKRDGKYTGIDPNDPQHRVYADRDAGGAWEAVILTRHDDGHFDVLYEAANRQLTITPDGRLESRPAGTFQSWERQRATNQPEGASHLYRDGVNVYLEIEARS